MAVLMFAECDSFEMEKSFSRVISHGTEAWQLYFATCVDADILTESILQLRKNDVVLEKRRRRGRSPNMAKNRYTRNFLITWPRKSVKGWDYQIRFYFYCKSNFIRFIRTTDHV